MSDRISPKMARRAVAMMCAVLDVPYTDTYDEAGWTVISVGLGRYAIGGYDGKGTSESRPVNHHLYTPRELYELAHFTVAAVEAAHGQEGTYPKIRKAMEAFDKREAESDRAHRRFLRHAAKRNQEIGAVLDAAQIIRQHQR